MKKSNHIISSSPNHNIIGGKAANLNKLTQWGFNVPQWKVIPFEFLENQIPNFYQLEVSEIIEAIDNFVFPQNFEEKILECFSDETAYFAVRSSGVDEDGADQSFAGQFETYLYVKPQDILTSIKKLWISAFSDRVIHYRKNNNLDIINGIGVIIQEMVFPDTAGVGFGLDPVSGDKSIHTISAVYGLGEGLVSGELDADTYKISNNKIEYQLATKERMVLPNMEQGGILYQNVTDDLQNVATLTDEQVKSISSILSDLDSKLNAPQDIEFAIKNDEIFLLQTRNVTTTKTGERIIWDNSNIIESYPGITTPLTYTFINKMYESVYIQFVTLLGVSKKDIHKNKNVFANTLGLIRGRVYYNLLSWYKMLALLPGYKLNAEFMETMMGVKEKFDIDEAKMSKTRAWLRMIWVIFNMIKLQFQLPNETKRFQKELNKTIDKYNALPYDEMAPHQIVTHYRTFEKDLLLEWKAPLINDFFAMIWFGLLKKSCEKNIQSENNNIHNDLLCGSEDIISVEPIKETMRISNAIKKDSKAYSFFNDNDASEIWKQLNDGAFPQVKELLNAYLLRFGERCMGELKLETISYNQDPTLFVKILKSYVKQDFKDKGISNVANEIREKAETEVKNAFKNKPIKRWFFNMILSNARRLVSNRENLRYERTRGFGMVRKMFSALGRVLVSEEKMKNPTDVFYLELDEILSINSTSSTELFSQKIDDRKKDFTDYKTQKPPSERFESYGFNFTNQVIYNDDKLEIVTGDLEGIGSSPGKVKSRVQVIVDPTSIDSLNGDILVTTSTDPGWVILFPSASGILVEKGSLLSHSAIVSREMGIPSVVGVTGLLQRLKTGDMVIMDGSTGLIEVVEES